MSESDYEYINMKFDKQDPVDMELLRAIDHARTRIPRATYTRNLLWIALVDEKIAGEPNIT